MSVVSSGVYDPAVIMDIIPEKLASLKRPALQKLCKKLGLKANGKVGHN